MNHVAAPDKTKRYIKDRCSDLPKFLADFFRTFFGVVTAKDPVSELLVWAGSVLMQASLSGRQRPCAAY